MFVCNKEVYGFLPVPLRSHSTLRDEMESFMHVQLEIMGGWRGLGGCAAFFWARFRASIPRGAAGTGRSLQKTEARCLLQAPGSEVAVARGGRAGRSAPVFLFATRKQLQAFPFPLSTSEAPPRCLFEALLGLWPSPRSVSLAPQAHSAPLFGFAGTKVPFRFQAGRIRAGVWKGGAEPHKEPPFPPPVFWERWRRSRRAPGCGGGGPAPVCFGRLRAARSTSPRSPDL